MARSLACTLLQYCPHLMFVFVFFSSLHQARFLLSKVNPSQTHNNMYAWGQVSVLVTTVSFFNVVKPCLPV